MGDGAHRDEEARDHEDPRFAECREVLCLPVPVLVDGVGRAHGDADREEGQQRSHEVGAGVKPLGDQPERMRDEADDELDEEQPEDDRDRDQRGAPLRSQGLGAPSMRW